MNTCWLLDAEIFDHYRDELAEVITQQGHLCRVIRPPAAGYSWEDEGCSYRQTFPADACVITHGDIALATRVRAERRWSPGAYGTVENYFCSRYYTPLGRYLLNSDYIMLPFGELDRCREFLFRVLGRNGQIFVRPDSPLKLFTGQTASLDSFSSDLEFMAFYDFPTHEMVVVSSPKEIIAEWRFAVVAKEVVAGCQYTENGTVHHRPEYDPLAHQLAQEIAQSEFAPDPVWVMDICRTSSGTYHLLEIGAFSFSDLYSMDKSAVVQAVSRQALKDWRPGKI